jgi:hypothetical protein
LLAHIDSHIDEAGRGQPVWKSFRIDGHEDLELGAWHVVQHREGT